MHPLEHCGLGRGLGDNSRNVAIVKAFRTLSQQRQIVSTQRDADPSRHGLAFFHDGTKVAQNACSGRREPTNFLPAASQRAPRQAIWKLRTDDGDLRTEDDVAQDARTRDAIHAEHARLCFVDVSA
jgi:hypothetical protein